MTRYFVFLLFCSTSLFVGAQSSRSSIAEMPLDSLAMQVLRAVNEQDRLNANSELINRLIDTLSFPSSYQEEFNELLSISRLNSPDDLFKLWTWQLPRKGGSFHHQGLLILPGEEENKVVLLTDTTDEWELPLYRQLKVSDWQGCIYYHIEKVKTKEQEFYTLLGYDQHNLQTRRKWIDVLSFEGEQDEIIRFGAGIFQTPVFQGEEIDRRPYRLVMQYSARFTAILRWEDKEDRILMDHLEPQDASMKRMYQFYGPDFTYDALYWKRDAWEIEEGVKVESDIQAPIVPPNRGEGLPAQKGRN